MGELPSPNHALAPFEVGDHRYPTRLTAGVYLERDRLNIPSVALFQNDREGVLTKDRRLPSREQLPRTR